MGFYSDQRKAFKFMEFILQGTPIKRTNLFYYVEDRFDVSELTLKKKLSQLIDMGFVAEDSDQVLTWTGKKDIAEKRFEYEPE